MFKHCLFLITFLSISVFAAAQKEEYSIRSQENALKNYGMVVGTITINNSSKKKHIYELVWRGSERTMGKTIINIIPARYRKYKFRPDYWDGNKAVYVVVWKRSAGDYYFSDVQWDLNKARDLKVRFPFAVEHKKITYFGNIEINDGEATVVISNKQERDMYLVLKKYPQSNWTAYENGAMILNAKQVGDSAANP